MLREILAFIYFGDTVSSHGDRIWRHHEVKPKRNIMLTESRIISNSKHT